MADNDSNIVKPVEGMQNITGLSPARRRQQRKRRQDLHEKGKQNPESAKGGLDEKNQGDEPTESEHPDSLGIDYRA